MHADAPEPSSTELRTGPRRGVLLVAACSLLAVGLGLNAHRHLTAPEELALEDDTQVTENRFVAYMYQPDPAPEEP